MKKIIALTLVLVMALSIAPFTMAADAPAVTLSDNVLYGGDFNSPASINFFKKDYEAKSLTYYSDKGVDGSGCVGLGVGSGSNACFKYIHNNIPLVVGRTYKMSCDVFIPANTVSFMQMDFESPMAEASVRTDVIGSWQHLEDTFTAVSNSNIWRIYGGIVSNPDENAAILIDNVSVIDVTTYGENLLLGGDFESKALTEHKYFAAYDSGHFTYHEDKGVNGSGCFGLDVADAGKNTCMMYQGGVPVEPGKSYIMTCDVYIPSGTVNFLTMDFEAGPLDTWSNGLTFQQTTIFDSWQRLVAVFDVPADYTKNSMRIYGASSATADTNKEILIDNVTLRCTDTSVQPQRLMTFSADTTYTVSEPLAAVPRTVEARIYFNSAFSGNGGVIFGNYQDSSTQYVSFGLNNDGNVRFQTATSAGLVTYDFPGTDVYTGDWVDVAVTWDKDNNQATCYINGEAIVTVTGAGAGASGDLDFNAQPRHRLGGDHRGGNGGYFKGQISNVAVYSDVRTAQEIGADRMAPAYTDPDLVCAYDLNGSTDLILKDLSTNKNHLVAANSSLLAGGMSFSKDKLYVMNDIPGAMVRTIEADLYLPTTADYGGGVLGNRNEDGTDEMWLEVGTSGNPILVFRKDNDTVKHEYNFDQIDVRTGMWTHLAITIEDNAVHCYINGELKQTIEKSVPEAVCAMPLCVGGYHYANGLQYYNDQYFRGRMASLALYGDVRTADEIMADTLAVDQDDPNLLAGYILNGKSAMADLSANGNDLSYPWIDRTFTDTDYDYTFAVVGDTQNLVRYYGDQVPTLYNWIANNAEDQKIEFVFGLGDMTDLDQDEEWNRVKSGIDTLKTAGIPFSMVRGNHDGNIKMNQVFPYGEYGNTTGSAVSGCYDGSYAENTYQMENYYQELTVGQTKYLMLSLEYGAPDGVLAWANEVIASYPDHQVIVTTHNFLDETGNLNDEIPQNTDPHYSGYYGEVANSSQDMWDECLSLHKNIVLVMSGHVFWNNIRHTELAGKYGNTVQALMINPQLLDIKYPVGMVALLHVWKDGRIEVEYYSTVKEQCYNTVNQFSFEFGDVVQAIIGDKEYADFDAAFHAATDGDTVTLLSDVKVNESALVVPEGVTVDLCGKRLQANNVLAFGNIIDSKQGEGGVVITNDRTQAFVQLQETNSALPLYDTANGCYRFVDYSFEYKIKETTETSVKYALHLDLPNAAAYALLKDTANSELISIRLLVNKADATKQKIDYTFMGSTLAKYADLSAADLSVKKAIVLTVSGLDTLNGANIEATARILSATGVAAQGAIA